MGTLQDYDSEKAARFYTQLRRRIAEWLDKKAGISPRVREYLLLLPDLFVLLMRLMGDKRIPPSMKAEMILPALGYVISPIDVIPDVFMPLGLLDDVLVVVISLSRVVDKIGKVGEDILREHWEGEGDILEQIQGVAEHISAFLNPSIVGKLLKRFGGSK